MKLEAQRAMILGAALLGYGFAAWLWTDDRLRKWGIDWRASWQEGTRERARDKMIREENMIDMESEVEEPGGG